jgi:hypothetical protein
MLGYVDAASSSSGASSRRGLCAVPNPAGPSNPACANPGGRTLSASAASYMGDLTFVPITGMPELRSALVWRRPACDPKLRAFIRVARDVLQSR